MIKFYFEYNGSKMQLPVNPKTFEMPKKNNISTTSILALGQVALSGDTDLQEIKISSFLPSSNKYSFILTKSKFQKPEKYITFFNQVMADKKPMTMTVTDLDISIDVLISNFSYNYNAGDDDVTYSLTLKEYKPYAVKTYTLEEVKTVVTETKREAADDKITVGKKVIVNGQLFADSYGGGAGKVLSNYTGVVSIIKEGRPKPYHIITLTGGWLGWVAASSIKSTGESSDVKMAVGSTVSQNQVSKTTQTPAIDTKNTETEYGTSKKTSISQDTVNSVVNNVSKDALKAGALTALGVSPVIAITTTVGSAVGKAISTITKTLYGSEKKTNIPKENK